MAIKNIGEKAPEWEIEEVSGNRWALKRHGLVVFVANSPELIDEWFKLKIHSEHKPIDPDALHRAIRNMN
jgi:hypothetical protein